MSREFLVNCFLWWTITWSVALPLGLWLILIKGWTPEETFNVLFASAIILAVLLALVAPPRR